MGRWDVVGEVGEAGGKKERGNGREKGGMGGLAGWLAGLAVRPAAAESKSECERVVGLDLGGCERGKHH